MEARKLFEVTVFIVEFEKAICDIFKFHNLIDGIKKSRKHHKRLRQQASTMDGGAVWQPLGGLKAMPRPTCKVGA